MLSPLFESRLEDLLVAWRHHNEVRRRRVSIAELAQARITLEAARNEAHRVRRALNPEPAEVSDSLGTAYCSSLEETVFLFATGAEWRDGRPHPVCLCGRVIDWAPSPVSPDGH